MTEKPIIFIKSFAILIAVLIVTALVVIAAGYEPVAGRFEVKTIYLDLKDSARNREVPVKIYCPVFEDMKPAVFGILAFH